MKHTDLLNIRALCSALGRILPVGLVVFSFATAHGQDIDPTGDSRIQPDKASRLKGQYQLFWSDEFNGTQVDEIKWDYRTGSKNVSTMLPRNNRIENGLLKIALKKETVGETEYTCGGLISKKYFRYGYYETSLKVPEGQGWHTSFWMMNNGPIGPSHIELDPFENDSINPYQYKVDAHQWEPEHGRYGDLPVNTSSSLAARFHVIGMEFMPDELRYYYNGKLTHIIDASQFDHNDVNIWLSSLGFVNSWNTPSIDDTCLPQEAHFDYVRYYKPVQPEGSFRNNAASE